MKLLVKSGSGGKLATAAYVLSACIPGGGLAQAIELKLAHFIAPKHPCHAKPCLTGSERNIR
ncbi:MAG: hypothetical protein K8F25_13965 [Fimbriimonadaceae bacterium]|nr:hypothetical protein [Alphaproteobacteria bacterium]